MKIDNLILKKIDNADVSSQLLFLADEDEKMIAGYRDKAIFWGAFDGEEMTGQLALVQVDKETAEVVNLAVYPQYENRKIGTRLIEAAVAWSKEKEFREILIKTGNCGIKQIQLYQRCGFRLHSINRDYMIRNYSEPIYENSIRCRDQVVLNYTLYSEEERKKAQDEYWLNFVKENPQFKGCAYEAWPFGIGDAMADQLIGLVQTGRKTATCSALALYGEGEKIPEAGDISMILYGNGMPGCIIETVEVREKTFCEISDEEARLEGEGDLSLKYWQDGHRYFFGLEFAEAGLEFTENITVLFERFKVIYNKEY